MRIWLVEPTNGTHQLKSQLQQLEKRPETGLVLLTPATAAAESAPENGPQAVVIDASLGCEEVTVQQALAIGAAVVVVSPPGQMPVLRRLCESHPIHLVCSTSDLDSLWFALQSASLAHQRQADLNQQITRLQQRLNDRIIIERAKGVLIQCMGISEEEAYQRLRVLSRQQQRRMRDVAQTLLNTRSLFLPRLAGIGLDEETPPDPGESLEEMAPKAKWHGWNERKQVALSEGSDYSQS